MTINILSDLHCRNKSFPPSFDAACLESADALVLAGDLGTHVNYTKILGKLKSEAGDKFKEVISIRGNHDYYITDKYWLRNHRVPVGPSSDDNFVQPVAEEGKPTVDFICTPLWSPIRDDERIRYSMNDYNYIPGFMTEACTRLFWSNLDWLECEVERSREAKHRVVIVTHHLPIRELIDTKYEGDPINEAFCVLDDEGEKRIKSLKPELWIHGHSHNFLDMTVDGVRYVRNPYGYEWGTHDYGTMSKEETGFKNNYIVTI